MGHRELKRVPLDFSWPLNQVWGGYLNPYYHQSIKCPDCENGQSPRAQYWHDLWYGYVPFNPRDMGSEPFQPAHPAIQALARHNYPEGSPRALDAEARRLADHFNNAWLHHLAQQDVQALLDAGRLYDFTRTPRTPEQMEIQRQKLAAGGNSWLPEPNGYTPTAAEVNEWSIGGFGHDSINSWVCVRARCALEGVETSCARCEGHGILWPTKEIEQAAETWEQVDPPSGPGYQLWETTSEGSPTTPVFASAATLAEWCESNASPFASIRWTRAQWLEMFGSDPDGVGTLGAMDPATGKMGTAAELMRTAKGA